ncbi:ATP synthase subunit gamma, mitochondrial-like isoform X1 [Fopius arisanus]|uniref:ATP synthase subunit gamma n=1 Tax=Fopius arisanus TaxID=64838 RepID=A0A9R1U917_9HYME|nr:PREDICTED: ATP synthase subunit gamma, mitochondrial-like isoform X1 [Fopius arisanus]
MSSLKVIKNRIKSVENTKKISRTMRLVSAAKYVKAERDLSCARTLGTSPQYFFEAAGLKVDLQPKSRLVLAVSGDRGLCGAIHSGIAKAVHMSVETLKLTTSAPINLICIGEKSRVILARFYAKKMLWTASEIGKKPSTFIDACRIAQRIFKSLEDHTFSQIQVYYNKFINPNVSIVSTIDLFDRLSIISAPKFVLYDGLDDNTVDCWVEFTFATIIYLVLKESSVAEHAARMTAMDNATKNASEMIKKLQLKFNRTRQAAITAELNEIISGASAIR